MASIRSGAKPALHLSLAPNGAESSPGTPGAASRRVPSWGSVTSSDTYQRLAAYGNQSMTALPSPLPSPLEGQEWGFLSNQPRRNRSDTGGTGASWLDGWGGSIGTNGTQRTVQDRDGLAPEPSEFGAFPTASTSALPDHSPPHDDGRKHPERSKTLSFFGTSSTIDDTSRALSPPPNPPSRQNSLRQRPEPSATLPLPPSPGWDQVVDPLRSSVASSSGGSWMEHGADDKNTWRRGRGSSIGSLASNDGSISRWPSLRASTGRYASPDRGDHSFTSDSDVSDLRPRLAALNTTALSPAVDQSPSAAGLANLPRPMSSLPSAIDGPASLPRSRFITLDTLDSTSPHTPYARRGFVDLDDEPSRQSFPSTQSSPRPAADFAGRRSTERERPRPPEAEDDLDEAPQLQRGDTLGDFVIERLLGKGAFSRVALGRRSNAVAQLRDRQGHSRTASRDGGGDGGLVALKLVKRKSCEGNERMRISVMREVEVLKTIQHPSLVAMFHSFTTPIYTALVLEYCDGGELFDFLASWPPHLTESLARRIFGELCSAVGWMHEICLVHRDIKLENILLTARPFPCADPSAVLATLPTPFIKLTDFGLSRFVNPASPLLATRCGSEEYAAPELIMGKMYDGRQTDAWALGVVLYAVVTGVMPFVEAVAGGSRARKAYLLKIAKADFRWPGQAPLSRSSSLSTAAASTHSRGVSDSAPAPKSGSATSSPHMSRLVTPAVQEVVERLLVRNPTKRATVSQLWEMEWMQGEGRPERRAGIVRRPDLGLSRERMASETWDFD